MKEPEEIIEAQLVAALSAAVPGMDVIGALAPAPEGEEKNSPDTYISVFADVGGQQLDFTGPNVPFSFSVRVTVHFALADDARGAFFRDTCRAVRGALNAFLGDGCEALSADGFKCDAFTLDSTLTSYDPDAAAGGWAKAYNATVNGRFTTETTTNEEGGQ